MSRETSLFVPVDLEAFCVGVTDVNGTRNSPLYGTINFAKIANDFSTLPYKDENGQVHNGAKATLSEAVFPGYFEHGPVNGPLEVGIHLHWALPDALAHGETTDVGGMNFREVPNRWLVVRVIQDGNTPHLDAWVVASDQLRDKQQTAGASVQNQRSKAVQVNPVMKQQLYRYQGKIYDYSDWLDPGNADAVAKNTVVGYGEATYAAAYVHSQNVFGFYDPLSDYAFDPNNPDTAWDVSYFVSGWYSDPGKDPLITINFPPEATYADRLALLEKTYNWTLKGEDTTQFFPEHTLCHGMVYNVQWQPGKVYVKPRKSTGDLKVAIGNSTAEALSALLANDPKLASLPNVEGLLNVLQAGLLSEVDRPGGLGDAEEKLHASSFSRAAAGPMWLVKRKDADRAQRSKTHDPKGVAESLLDAAAGQDRPLPENIAGLLDQLNEQQLGADRLQEEIRTRRSQLFADWYKYMVVEYPATGVSPPAGVTANGAFDYLKSEAAAIAGPNFDGNGGKEQVLDELNAGVKLLKTQLEQQLTPLKLELVEVQSPRYWQAADPVLLLSGADVEPSYRHGMDGRHDADGHLVCRVTGQLVTELNVNKNGNVVATANAANLPVPVGPSQPQAYEIQVASLLDEFLLISPPNAGFLAKLVGGAADSTAIAAAQANLLAGKEDQNQAVTFTGVAPSPVAFKDWGGASGTNPWVPIMMQWEIDYDPALPIRNDRTGTDTNYPPDFITKSFGPNDAETPVELVAKTAPTGNWNSLQFYRGGILLSANTEINLKEQISRFVANYPQDRNVGELNSILSYLDVTHLARQGQALSGFNEALLMRELILQLPVFDPLSPSFLTQKFINKELPPVIGGENATAPLPLNYYNPLRAGYGKVSRVRIIDAFGQFVDITTPETLVAESLRPVGPPIKDLIAFHPRITQPSRLLFRWIAAADNSVESNTHPVTTPIYGWVLYNHLDDSLVVYDGEGGALGSFNMRGPIWEGAPGDQGSYGSTDPTASLAGLADTPGNAHLKEFVNGIYAKLRKDGNLNYLEAMLAAMDRSVTNIDPSSAKQHANLSVLIGRPLALTRASLKLEIAGLPALDQSWPAFASTLANGSPAFDQRQHAKFEQVNFPVSVGDLSKVNDGLVGYFITDEADDSLEAYGTFYAPAINGSSQGGKGVVDPPFSQLQLTPSYGVKTQSATAPGGGTYTKAVGQTNENTLFLTMLIDPRASVHATTGILPTKAIDIPPDFYSSALAKMSVTFLTSPILTSAHKLSLPLPKEPGYDWSWIKDENGEWAETLKISPVNPRAAFSYPPVVVEEGWLRLRPEKDKSK